MFYNTHILRTEYTIIPLLYNVTPQTDLIWLRKKLKTN